MFDLTWLVHPVIGGVEICELSVSVETDEPLLDTAAEAMREASLSRFMDSVTGIYLRIEGRF